MMTMECASLVIGAVKKQERRILTRTCENGLIQGEDGRWRCQWHGNDPEYMRYHDEEWGMPVKDDIRLFEKINLEGFQAGLSWLTILRKRENFRKAFDGFDFIKIGEVAGVGTTNEVQDYSFIHDLDMTDFENLSYFYYRLKQVDFDGKYEYSDIVNITIEQYNIIPAQLIAIH